MEPQAALPEGRYCVPIVSNKAQVVLAACVAAALVAIAFVVPSVGTAASTRVTASAPYSSSANLVVGKELYREYCGQCHALSAASAAGFGSNDGLGQFGGPSFNNLRITYSLSLQAINEGFAEHEVVATKLGWKQADQVSAYTAEVTGHNAYPGHISDG